MVRTGGDVAERVHATGVVRGGASATKGAVPHWVRHASSGFHVGGALS